MYNVYITKVKNIRPAENADRLNLCEVFGNTTVVDKTVNEQELYVYLPTDGQISVAYGEANNLFRKKDAAGNSVGGFIDHDKRNIRAIRLRGNRSDGLVMPLSSLASFGDTAPLKEGDIVTVFNGHEIARKYIPKTKGNHVAATGNKTRKKKVDVAPLFAEHADTEQLAYNLGKFTPGDTIEITLKMHGTSQRTGYLPIFKGYKRTFLDWILRRDGKPIYEYGYVSGTRRVVLDNFDGGFYGSNSFREQHSKVFEGKLWKSETVYYEVVGFTDTGVPIMGSCSNKKISDPAFVKQYGEQTVFSYGCASDGHELISSGVGCNIQIGDVKIPDQAIIDIYTNAPKSAAYVYRMTMTNEDGNVIEYTPDFMRYRCEQMGVKFVPVLWDGKIKDYALPTKRNGETQTAGEYIMKVAEHFCDGADPIGKTHVREGVVVRIVNRPKFTAYKHKNFNFKLLSGIAIEQAESDGTIEDMNEDLASEM